MKQDPNMMDENVVVEAVRSFLVQNGYEIKSWCSTAERGIDVCAEKTLTGEAIHVEAKGATSSQNGSKRFGKPFNGSQVFDVVAKALYTVLKMQGMGDGQTRYVMALPDAEPFRRRLAPIRTALEKVGIGVFLVDEARRVRVFTDFSL